MQRKKKKLEEHTKTHSPGHIKMHQNRSVHDSDTTCSCPSGFLTSYTFFKQAGH